MPGWAGNGIECGNDKVKLKIAHSMIHIII